MGWELIEDPAGLAELIERVAGETVLAVDTEAASFHRYYDRIYLIQVSSPTLTALIDPLGVGELESFGRLLADSRVIKIFHDADYDLRLFDKTLDIHASNLFDTRIAAQFAGEPGIGLAALLEKYFGVHPDKRFQRADWSLRPLSGGMLEYAAGDTSHLHALREVLTEKLEALGRLAWVQEEFGRLEEIRSPAGGEEKTPWLSIKGARDLSRRDLAVLRELYQWRDGVAAESDRALFRVVGNEVLLHLAANPVDTQGELESVRGLNRDLAARRGEEILASIRRGLNLPEAELPQFPRHRRHVPDPDQEQRKERLKQRRNLLAEELALPPGVLCPNGTLEIIARDTPQSVEALAAIPEVRQWQAETIGNQLLAAMNQTV